MWKLGLILGLAASVAGFATGWRVHDWRDAAAAVGRAKAVVRVVEHQAAVSQSAAVRDQAAEDKIRTVTRTIVERTPVYVTPATDARFPLPLGFVRVHDAAAAGVDLSTTSESPGQPDDAASTVAASSAAAVIATNYGECRVDQARLVALQAWAKSEGLAN